MTTYSTKHREYYEENRNEIRAKQNDAVRVKKQWACDILGGACMRCGYSDIRALQFHHRDPQLKVESVSKMLTAPKKWSQELLIAEIAKCDLLCANCHKIEHCTWEA